MSYVVLARKYRPPDFASLVGQAHVVQALSNALTQQRLHHAYLFTGTRGVGKTTISRILAKSLNCTGADGRGAITAHPCGICDACRDIDAGRFIDYVELDAASNRGVDEISLLLDQAVYKPVLGRFKVYMIDEVHMLSTTAFNAMLKTLEEPPEYLKFVLATTDPQKVPPTVLSRCLQFNLRPMAPQTVQEHLVDVLAREQIEAEPAALRLLARAARGSMRDALSLADQAIAYGAGHIDEVGVRQMLGAVDRSHAVRLVEALAAGDGAALIGVIDGLRELGLSAGGTLEELAMLLQQMAVLQAVPAAADADDPEAPTAARLAALLAADETQLLYSMVLHGRAELGLAPDEYSGLVMVLLRWLAFRPGGHGAVLRAQPAPVATPRTVALASAAPQSAPAVALAQPAVVAAARTLRVPAPLPATRRDDEPPAWLDVPFEGEAGESSFAALANHATSVSPQQDALLPRPFGERAGVRGSAGRSDGSAVPHPNPLPEGEGENAPGVQPVRTVPTAPAIGFKPTATGERWAELVRNLSAAGSISAFGRELAMQSQCLVLDETVTPIICRLRVERDSLRASAPCDKLQAALGEALKRPVRLAVEAGAAEDSLARRDAAERSRRQAEAEQIIHDDPLVRALMAQYKSARIVPGSVKFH